MFPEKAEIILDRDGSGIPVAYASGEYHLNPNSIYVKDEKVLVAPRLVPIIVTR